MPRLSDLERDLRAKANRAVRTVARNIMNDLAAAGPVWGGEFRDSWEAYSPSTGQSIPAQYPYSIKDVPDLPLTKKEQQRVTKFIIRNTAPHAAIAMDMEVPADGFVYPGYGPEGDVLFRGTRPAGGLRGAIGARKKGGSDNRSTAPLDWFPTYMAGGKKDKAVENGVKIEFPK